MSWCFETNIQFFWIFTQHLAHSQGVAYLKIKPFKMTTYSLYLWLCKHMRYSNLSKYDIKKFWKAFKNKNVREKKNHIIFLKMQGRNWKYITHKHMNYAYNDFTFENPFLMFVDDVPMQVWLMHGCNSK